jgi:SAM-dependent methyltransferase
MIPLIESVFSKSNGYRLSIGFKAPQFVYGELQSLSEYYKLFSHSEKLKSNSTVFTDLGSGIGKANLVVAGCFNIRKSLGIEIIPRMYEHSRMKKSEFLKKQKNLKNFPIIQFFKGNITKTWETWKESDVVFMNCVCWKKKMIDQVVSMVKGLKPGTEIFSTNPLNSLFLKEKIDCNACWSNTSMFLYQV